MSNSPLDCPPDWSVVSSPNPGASTNYLFGVAAASFNDIWAVGEYDLTSGGRAVVLALHWDGIQWTQVPCPSPGDIDDEFGDVVAVSSNNVWAIGYTYSTGGPHRTLIEHWDGLQWSIVPSPNVGSLSNYLYRVSAVSTNDVWAVGYYLVNIGGQGFERTLVEHWDGVQWSVISSPNVGTASNELRSISALSPSDIWAVGIAAGGVGALIEHWDGVQWSISPSRNPNTNNNYLSKVAIIASADVWTVGISGGASWLTLTEHFSVTDACLTPSATSTTTLTPTSTRTPSLTRTSTYTRTPTPTATITLTFSTTPTTTDTRTPTDTSTETTTRTLTSTPNSTPTSTSISMLIGHVIWEARPPQPSSLQQLPITITLKLDALEVNYPTQLTDQYGYFTVTLGSLPIGTYAWRVDDANYNQHSPNYLANTGTVTLTGVPTTNEDMGTMRAGDANNDNLVSLLDFNVLKGSFGFGCGQPGYDNRADFTGDCVVNIADFNPLKNNFGHAGAPPIGPGMH